MTTQKEIIKLQISSLEAANAMMEKDWGYATNDPGFKMAEHPFMKKLLDVDYICPFAAPFSGGAKPFLAEMYKLMNEELIKELQSKLKALEE